MQLASVTVGQICMNVELKYGNKPVADYLRLIDAFPESEFDSPYRSTVPLLCFWSNTHERLNSFAQLIGIKPFSQVTASFEFAVDVQKGKGQPSMTDLMILSDDHAIAIEGKYTEPPYETVDNWKNSPNKELVLKGWFELISSAIPKSRLNIDNVAAVSYQMIHRCASACFPAVVRRVLVYQCFDLDAKKTSYYRSELENLYRLLNEPDNLNFFLINVPLVKSPVYVDLQNRWDSSERNMHVDVIRGLKANELLAFGEPAVFSIE